MVVIQFGLFLFTAGASFDFPAFARQAPDFEAPAAAFFVATVVVLVGFRWCLFLSLPGPLSSCHVGWFLRLLYGFRFFRFLQLHFRCVRPRYHPPLRHPLQKHRRRRTLDHRFHLHQSLDRPV